MNAKEYFIQKYSEEELLAQSYDWVPADLAEFAEEYHRFKIEEITKGKMEWAFKDNAKWELADRTKMMNIEEFKTAIIGLLHAKP